MKNMVIAAVLAFGAGVWMALLWISQPLEQRLVEVQLAALMPQQAMALHVEPLDVQVAMLDFAQGGETLATKAHLALSRHGDTAREVLATYSDDPLFRAMLLEYGEAVVPPVYFFMRNELPSLALYKRVGDATAALRQKMGGPDAVPPAPLTSVERGRFAIRFIEAGGHDFLGQFVIAQDGSVARVQTERVTEGVVDFLTGGIRGLEIRMRQGEEVRPADAGWAALDVAIGASALKLLRIGRAAAVTTRGAAVTPPVAAALGSTLLRGSRVGLQIARIGGPVALAYIVVRHPSLLHSAFARIAQACDLPVWLVQSAGWGLVLFPLVVLLRWLLRPLAVVLGMCGAALRWCDRRLSARTA